MFCSNRSGRSPKYRYALLISQVLSREIKLSQFVANGDDGSTLESSETMKRNCGNGTDTSPRDIPDAFIIAFNSWSVAMNSGPPTEIV